MKIICIGRNYVDHAKELNNPLPESPLFFMKPETAIQIRNRPFYYPNFTKDLHYEVELVLKISKNGKYIEEKFAHKYYSHIGIGIDLTARDLQRECKTKGLPWEIAKAFDFSAPVSEFLDKEKESLTGDISFSLLKNGELCQQGNSRDMIFSFDKLISYLSKFVSLKMGDMIFTGTPAGVGALQIGDELEAFIGDKSMLKMKVK